MLDFLITAASSYAIDIDRLFLIVFFLTGFWLLLAEGVLFYFIFKFKRKEGVRGQYITGEEKHHTKWIKIPHNLILICDVVIIVVSMMVWYHIKQTLPEADETIRIVGQQWSWRFVDPGADKQLGTADDVETVDEMHVKVDTTYHFKLESTDVLHSFSVPVFRLKQDAVPGRIITGWFRPTKVGVYDIQCTQMCGIGHGIMQSRLYVESEEDHKKWLSQHTAQSH